MSYSLAMSEEIHDWLTDLSGTDPAAAHQVGQALIALLTEGTSLGPPAVTSLGDAQRPADLREALDYSYQHKLEELQVLRRHLADASTLASEMELQIAELDQSPETRDQAAELRQLLPGVVQARQRLGEQSQRMHRAADAFRVRKETLKAAYTAAEGERAVSEVFAAVGGDPGDDGAPDDRDARSAPDATKLAEIVAKIERELRDEYSAQDLLELRPGAPGRSDISLIFAVEPPGTALLIALLEGREAIESLHGEAVLVAADVLRRARAGQAQSAAARTFADAPEFLTEFFANSDEVRTGAAAFVTANRTRSVAARRQRLGLSIAEVARRTGVPQDEITAIELAELDGSQIGFLTAYIEALGGRLELIADFGADRVQLR